MTGNDYMYASGKMNGNNGQSVIIYTVFVQLGGDKILCQMAPMATILLLGFIIVVSTTYSEICYYE